MTDILFPEIWPEINIDDYIAQHGLAFDQVDLRAIPHYLLVNKIKVGGMMLALLENDPMWDVSQKRQQLNEATQKEIRRQLGLLVREYNRRVQVKESLMDSLPKTFLSNHTDARPSSEQPPPHVVVGVKSVVLGSSRG